MPQIKKKPTHRVATDQKLQCIQAVIKQGPELKKQLSDEYITLNGLKKQKSALDNFNLYENTGADLLKKYDLVPGTDLYKIIAELKEIEFDKMTQNQKQMVLLILYTGIFEGVYELFDARPKSKLSSQQTVALSLMGQDAEKLKKNIVSVLNKIEKTGVDSELEQKFHGTFDAYYPKNWGPRKTHYDTCVFNQCAKWSEKPDKNDAKILDHKDYMIASLVPQDLPALFRLIHIGAEASLNPEKVDRYFTDFRSVSNSNILISHICAWGWPNEYALGPSVTLWIQNMHAGMEQSILAAETRIENLTAAQVEWKKTIAKMYKQLPTNNPINKVEKAQSK